MVADRWVEFSTSSQNSTFSARQKKIELYLTREAGLFCTTIHQGEPLWLFQCLSKAGFFFSLACRAASWIKGFSIIFDLSLLLTSPHYFHLPSFVPSPSLQRHLFIYLTFQEVPSFWCDKENFWSVDQGSHLEKEIHTYYNPIFHDKCSLFIYLFFITNFIFILNKTTMAWNCYTIYIYCKKKNNMSLNIICMNNVCHCAPFNDFT